MKRFLTSIACFSLIVILTLVAAECYVRSLPNPSKDKHLWMLRNSQLVETLVLGNSQTFYGINPQYLGSHAYSLAQTSQTLRYDDYLFHAYQMPHLRNVILPLTYSNLYEDFEGQSDWFYAIRYRLYMDCDIHPLLSRYGFECMSRESFIEKLKSLWTPQQMEWNGTTGFGIYRKENRKMNWDNGAFRALKNTHHTIEKIVSTDKYISNIFDDCAKRHIRVLLVMPPVSKTYLAGRNSKQVERNLAFIAALCQKYGKTICLLNFEGDKRFVSDDFFDGDHLNSDGARKFSMLVKPFLQ